ncbi:MAG: M23 family metallopeptidase [Gemmatimonadota bacterium]
MKDKGFRLSLQSICQPNRASLTVVLASTVGVGACAPPEAVEEWFRPDSPHAAYAHGLEQAGLAESALGRAWQAAADSVLEEPASVPLPYREEGLLPPAAPGAVGFQVELKRGERLTVEVSLEDALPRTAVFVDLFRVHPEEDRGAFRVQSDTSSSGVLSYTVRRPGPYRIRIQPELLRGGRYQVTLQSLPSLVFPVEGRGASAILSFFGAQRDAGRRQHHGVDIFAPRGTPVLAATAGTVSRVREAPLGGKVVWVRDPEANESHYYAHLDNQLVEEGSWVEPGDTIGLVGNTGNARTTPPHLHFGIYARGMGPVDPLPYLDERQPALPSLRTSENSLRTVRVVASGGGILRSTPSTRGPVLVEVAPGTPVHVEAGLGDWYRVRLETGEKGFLFARRTQEMEMAPGSAGG